MRILNKNISEAEVKQYALRRTKSSQFFNNHNEKPYTHGPDYYYHHPYPEYKSFGKRKEGDDHKYVEVASQMASSKSMPSFKSEDKKANKPEGYNRK